MKAAHKSKSIIFYTLSLITTIGTALLADQNFKDLIGDNVGYITGAMGIAGLWLRLVTKGPIGKESLEVLDVHDPEYEG